MSSRNKGAMRAGFLNCSAGAAAAIGCFVCLPSISAAGQQITLKPNKKIASILESGPIPRQRHGYSQWYEQVENRKAISIVALVLRDSCKTHPLEWPVMNPPGAAAGSTGTGMVLSEPPDLSATFPDGSGMEIFDSLTALHPSFRILPGSTSQLRFSTTSQAVDCSARVSAVLFADESSEGDRRDLLRIYRQRQGANEALVRLIPIIERVTDGRTDLPTAVQALYRSGAAYQSVPQSLAGSANYGWSSVSVPFAESGWYTPSERAGANQVYNAVRLALVSQRGAKRFPWKVASAQGSATNVAAQSGNPFQARAALLLSEMQAWRAALDGHLKPVKGK